MEEKEKTKKKKMQFSYSQGRSRTWTSPNSGKKFTYIDINPSGVDITVAKLNWIIVFFSITVRCAHLIFLLWVRLVKINLYFTIEELRLIYTNIKCCNIHQLHHVSITISKPVSGIKHVQDTDVFYVVWRLNILNPICLVTFLFCIFVLIQYTMHGLHIYKKKKQHFIATPNNLTNDKVRGE